MRKQGGFFFLISFQLLLTANAVLAQTITSQKGLTTAYFTTSAGSIQVRLPNDIRVGDHISGSILSVPTGRNAKLLEKNVVELAALSINVNGEKFPVSSTEKSFQFIVQQDRPMRGTIELLNVGGAKVAELNIPMIPPNEQKPVPDFCQIPSHAMTGAPLVIQGPFDGNSSNTKCLLGNKELPIIAESPRQCIAIFPQEAGGKNTMTVQENQKPPCSQNCNGVIMDVSAGKLDLRKGESTYIDVSIRGLEGLPDTAKLTIANMSTDVVIMEPSNFVMIPLPPDSVGSGTFQKRFNLQSTRTGTFTVNVDLDLPPVQSNSPGTTEKVPPGYTKKSCACSATASIAKNGANGFSVNVNGECKGQYGIGINTFPACSVTSISYEWSIANGKENASISGKNNGTGVKINPVNNGNYVVCVKVTVTCIDGGTCSITACADQNGKPAEGPGTVSEPPVTGVPEQPTTTTSSRCQCKASCEVIVGPVKNGEAGYSGKVTAACTGTYGTGSSRIVCAVGPIVYAWSIGASGKDVAEIVGKSDGPDVKVKLKKEGAYNIYLSGTVTCSDGTVCEFACNWEVPYIPTTNAPQCNIVPSEDVTPAMVGGLKAKYITTRTIRRDDFIELGAEGSDADLFTWNCNPTPECKDTRSQKTILLNSKVRFEWAITSADDASFVKLGCLPDPLKTDKGDNIIFKPPYVPLPAKGKESIITTIIKLTVIDDNPSQPVDGVIEKIITITTKRTFDKPDQYTIEVKSDKPGILKNAVPPPIPGSCTTTGPAWSMAAELAEPVISLPAVPQSDKMVLGQWIALETQEQKDGDKLSVGCSSNLCPTGGWSKVYEDKVLWDWSIVSGGGKLISDPSGRVIIYEAPMEMSKGKPFIEVKIKVHVKNGGGKINDKEYDGYILLKIYQPGVKLSQPAADWVPEEDNDLELKSELMYKDGEWKPALAHMCRIHFFELVNISTEKGVCLNSPVPKDANDCRDLQLKNENKHEAFDDVKGAGKCTTKELYQQARTQKPEKEYSINVHSLDFGSYGFLRSFANINKKTSLEGKPVYISIPVKKSEITHPGGRAKKTEYPDNRVTIPLDIDENQIPDAGYTTQGGVNVPDPADKKEDADEKPVGDAFKGDGFTNYEEYRGFKVTTGKGKTIKHERSNYLVKNIFIRNEHNLNLSIYEDVSGLDVYEISEEQYIDDKKRVVNFNFNPNSHVVDQMGLHLADKGSSGSLLGIAYSPLGHPTIPNAETEIRVYGVKIKSSSMKRKIDPGDKLNAVVAHELLHGNNVCHHGEGDPDVEKSFNLIHGLRSGSMECVMRYDNVGDIVPGYDPEVIPVGICSLSAGTGYNAGGGYFQEAAKKRGNCKGQIRVSAKGGIPKPCGNR